MMACSHDVSDESDAPISGEGADRYRVAIKSQLWFSPAAEYLLVRLFFRQVARVLLFIRKRSGLASMGLRNDVTV